jgi:alpha-aminoadipate carrier protein LysW
MYTLEGQMTTVDRISDDGHAVTELSADCPECAARVPMARKPVVCEVLYCGQCQAELEVVDVSPVTLALAPEVEEDWGE